MRSQYQVPFDDPSADGQPSWSGQYTADSGSHGTDTPDRGNTPIAPVSGRPTASAYPLDRPYPGCPPVQAIERFFHRYAGPGQHPHRPGFRTANRLRVSP